MNDSNTLCVVDVPIDRLQFPAKPAREHAPGQIRKLRSCIREFGFLQPILIDGNDVVIAGLARLEAARDLGIRSLPCIRTTHLSEAERRAYAIADNKWTCHALVPPQVLV